MQYSASDYLLVTSQVRVYVSNFPKLVFSKTKSRTKKCYFTFSFYLPFKESSDARLYVLFDRTLHKFHGCRDWSIRSSRPRNSLGVCGSSVSTRVFCQTRQKMCDLISPAKEKHTFTTSELNLDSTSTFFCLLRNRKPRESIFLL